jgi:hypothetical protein
MGLKHELTKLRQPNNTLKHEIQIDNLKNLQKMLSSENNFSGIS